MRQALTYIMKVWITTGILTPVILVFINHWALGESRNYWLSDVILMYGMSVFIGILLSVFPVVLMLFAVYYVSNKHWTIIKSKAIIFIVVEVFLFIMMSVLQSENELPGHKIIIDPEMVSMWLPYALVIGVAIWIYKLKPVDNLGV